MITSPAQAAPKMRDWTTVGWLPYALLAAITLLGLGLRFYRLGDWSFWIDEVFTLERAQAHYTSLESALRFLPPQTKWVPLSVILTGGTINWLGVSEWSVRVVSAAAGVLTIPILYFPVRSLFGARTALIFALLLAVSPWHVQWSQNGRFYAPLMLLYALAAFAFYFGLKRDRPLYLLLGYALFYLSLSERQIAGLLAPSLAFYLVALPLLRFRLPAGFNPRNITILAAPVLAAMALEAYSILVEGSPRLLAEVDVFVGNPVDSPVRILILMLFSIGLPVVVLAIFSAAWLIGQRSRSGLYCAINAGAPIVLLIAMSPWAFVVDRYAFVTLTFWLILAAVAVDKLALWLPQQGRWLAAAVLALLLADAAGAHMMYYQINLGNRPAWRDAFAYVETHMQEDDLVVTTRPPVGSYYLPRGEVLDMASITPETLSAATETVWFVTDSEGIWYAPLATREWLEEHAQLLLVSYLRVREEINLKVYRYQPHGDRGG